MSLSNSLLKMLVGFLLFLKDSLVCLKLYLGIFNKLCFFFFYIVFRSENMRQLCTQKFFSGRRANFFLFVVKTC